jgi:hypothetical protein
MNYDNIVRLAFTHQENEHASIREIARLLDMNPGGVYRVLLRIGLVKRPPRTKKRLECASKPGKLIRIPRPDLQNPLLANVYDELEMTRATRTGKNHEKKCSKKRQGKRPVTPLRAS